MILLNRETRKSVSMVGANGDLNDVGRFRLTRELFCEQFRPGRRVRLREIAAKYGVDNDAVLKLFSEFQSLGLITLSGKFSAIVHSPNAKEMHEAYVERKSLPNLQQDSVPRSLENASVEPSVMFGKTVQVANTDCGAHSVQFFL